MVIYIDKATKQFITDPTFKSRVDSFSFKRGDKSEVEVYFVNGNSVESLSLSASADVRFGIKPDGEYDGEFLVYSDDFTYQNQGYKLEPSFNTTILNAYLSSGDGNANNDIAQLAGMLEITWSDSPGLSSWQSTPTVTALIDNDVIKGIEGTPSELPDALDWLQENGIVYNTDIIALTGGTSIHLDALPTVGIPLNSLLTIKVGTNNIYTYRLADSTSTTSIPSRIRPLDYNNPSNKKVWFLTTQYFSSINCSSGVFTNSLVLDHSSGNSGGITADTLTEERSYKTPDANGTIPIVPSFPTSTEADASLSPGEFYWNVALGKLMVAVAV